MVELEGDLRNIAYNFADELGWDGDRTNDSIDAIDEVDDNLLDEELHTGKGWEAFRDTLVERIRKAQVALNRQLDEDGLPTSLTHEGEDPDPEEALSNDIRQFAYNLLQILDDRITTWIPDEAADPSGELSDLLDS